MEESVHTAEHAEDRCILVTEGLLAPDERKVAADILEHREGWEKRTQAFFAASVCPLELRLSAAWPLTAEQLLRLLCLRQTSQLRLDTVAEAFLTELRERQTKDSGGSFTEEVLSILSLSGGGEVSVEASSFYYSHFVHPFDQAMTAIRDEVRGLARFTGLHVAVTASDEEICDALQLRAAERWRSRSF